MPEQVLMSEIEIITDGGGPASAPQPAGGGGHDCPGRIDHRPAVFSGAMQQRLHVARSLVFVPCRVIIDANGG